MTPTTHIGRNGLPLAPTTYRATIRSHADRAVPDEAPAILAEGLVAHVGFVEDGQPYVIPMSYHYDPAEPRRLHLHAARAGRILQALANGIPVCVTVTLVDGLVYSRSAISHSINYRSAVCYGRATTDQADPAAALEAMIERYFPGRRPGRDYEAPSQAHLDATGFVTIEIEEWSAKARRGGPTGPKDRDPNAPGTAGVVEL